MRTKLAAVAVLLSIHLATAGAQSPSAPGSDLGPQPITPAMQQRVDAMVGKLTLEQKLELLGGVNSMETHAEPSIGLPRIRMSDGPMGVRTWGPTTAYAAGLALAATWDTDLAQQVGTSFGNDARARGVDIVLAPGVNIYRVPMNGRNFEYYGEDPYLASQMAVQFIRGLQSRGVIATVKHFAMNNSEFDRHTANSIADERTMRELYLPAFEAAVTQAHVGAVMDSYNLVNGHHATQNSFLNTTVLRHDWGFDGILMSDWDATTDGIAAANSGLDLEMPSGKFMNASTLLPAIHDGRVSEATIDLKVTHILQTAMRFGFFDHEQADLSIPSNDPRSAVLALKSAEESAVLLKNEGRLLPLDGGKLHTIAVIGPNSFPAIPGGGGSSEVTAFDPVSVLTGLTAGLPGTKVLWRSGLRDPAEIFKNTTWCVDAACTAPGIERVEYNLATGAKSLTKIDTAVDDSIQSSGPSAPAHTRRIEWTGYFVPKSSGSYFVVADVVGRASFRILLNGRQVLEDVQEEGGMLRFAKVELERGTPAKLQYIYLPVRDENRARFGIVKEDEMLDPEAVNIAKSADAVVLAAGFSPKTESEGLNRSYSLPFGQPELIKAIAEANSRTIVVLNAGGSVATSDWLPKVPALLDTWYGGQAAGTALARILLGDVNPSGRLPISWEKKIEDNPAYRSFYEQPGTHDIRYTEGLFLGYRYYTTRNVRPLFPFGFGLSYTTFSFSDLKVSPSGAGTAETVRVAFDVTNTGSVAGAEVAQVYVGDPSATVPRPAIELKAFARVELAPGERRHIETTLNSRALAYWSEATHRWTIDPGQFAIFVGDCSEDLPLHQSFTAR